MLFKQITLGMLCPVDYLWCKWIYSLELKTNDTLDRNKAHPVALGYCNKQEYGIDYDKTFAPAKMTTMSMILATAAAQS